MTRAQRETLEIHGMAPDLQPTSAPLNVWNNADGVIFRNKESRRSKGDKPTLNPARTPRTMVYCEPFNTGYWVYCDESAIYAHDGATEYDITPAGGWAGGAPDTFTSCVLNGLPVINCSTLPPVYWDGLTGNPCQELPGWISNGRCLAMRAHKNFLFAVGMYSEGEQRVRWSDAAEAGTMPQEWTPSASNLAGFVDIAPLSSPALDGKTLRDSFLVYKNQSIWSFDFVGGNAIFAARKLFAEIGIAATGAITSGPNDEHLFASANGDIFLTDAVQVRSVLDGRAQQTFYNDVSGSNAPVYAGCTIMREKLGFIFYPVAGSTVADRAMVYDFSSGDIGTRPAPGVYCAAEGQELQDVGDQNIWDADAGAWNDDRQAWNQQISGQSVEDCLIGGALGFAVLESGEGASVSARLEKTGLAFGDAQRRKQIVAIWPKVTGREGDIIKMRFGGQESAGGAVQWTQAVNYEVGQEEPVHRFVQGRYMAIEVSSDAGDPWTLGTIDVEFSGVGKW